MRLEASISCQIVESRPKALMSGAKSTQYNARVRLWVTRELAQARSMRPHYSRVTFASD